MTHYQDLLFFIPAILAVLFMVWVLFQFTQQLAGPGRSAGHDQAEARYLRVIPENSSQRTSASAHDRM